MVGNAVLFPDEPAGADNAVLIDHETMSGL
jgi:hypothetical protein